MRDVSAGRDIVNSTIMEVVGNNPTVEILQQPAEELAAAEKLSHRVVREGRKKRSLVAAILSLIALVALAAACLLGYYWLLQGGKIEIADVIRDTSNIGIDALVSTLVSATVGVATAIVAYWQKEPTEAETLNSQRLRTIATRWDELRLLGFPRSEIKNLRKRS